MPQRMVIRWYMFQPGHGVYWFIGSNGTIEDHDAGDEDPNAVCRWNVPNLYFS